MSDKVKTREDPQELQDLGHEFALKMLASLSKEEAERFVSNYWPSLRPRFEGALREQVLKATRINMDELGYRPEVSLFAKSLADEAGISRTEAYIKGLALLKFAIDAQREGNKIVVVDRDDTIVREIVGIDTPFQVDDPLIR